jgi:ribosomal protein L4
LKGTKVVTASKLNTYDIMDCKQIIFDAEAIAEVVNNLKA